MTATGGDDAAALPDDAVEVGRVTGAWGIKGAIKVQPYTADPQALFSSKRWFLRPGTAVRPAGVAPLPGLLRVATAREQGGAVVATVHDVADRNAAEALKGARVFVSRASFPTPDVDEFYWVDLIGLAVANRQGTALGTVVGLIETGPHCVLRVLPDVAGAGAAEVLIPFVAQYVDAVELAARRIAVDWEVDPIDEQQAGRKAGEQVGEEAGEEAGDQAGDQAGEQAGEETRAKNGEKTGEKAARKAARKTAPKAARKTARKKAPKAAGKAADGA